MVARVFAAARFTVHAGRAEARRQRRTEQQMIDAETGVAREGVPKIRPERIDPFARVLSPERVGPALRDQRCAGSSPGR